MSIVRCGRCKVNKDINDFDIKKDNKHYKYCKRCRLVNRAWITCNHGRQRTQCIEGTCQGSAICIHKMQRLQCKLCTDPIKVIIRRWIYHSKEKDILYNRYDRVNFIDTDFCKLLIDDYKNCYYCQDTMQYIEYNDSLATIERLDNTIGHIKANCVVACKKCNISKVGNRTTPDAEANELTI